LDGKPFNAKKRSVCSDVYAMRPASDAKVSRGPAEITLSLRGFIAAAWALFKRDMLENIWSNGLALMAVIVTK
jgi:hypothetical protein